MEYDKTKICKKVFIVCLCLCVGMANGGLKMQIAQTVHKFPSKIEGEREDERKRKKNIEINNSPKPNITVYDSFSERRIVVGFMFNCAHSKEIKNYDNFIQMITNQCIKWKALREPVHWT